jgi:hypothetical protein
MSEWDQFETVGGAAGTAASTPPEEDWNQFEPFKVLGGALADKEKTFIEAGTKHGVDPKLLMAVSMFETGNGTSHAARAYKNVGGLMDPRSPNARGFQKFENIDEGIEAMASNLRRNYIDKGLTNIPDIGRKYAPPGAANDPNATNAEWPSAVMRNYAKLGGGGEITTAMPVELVETRIERGQPVKIQEIEVRRGKAVGQPPSHEATAAKEGKEQRGKSEMGGAEDWNQFSEVKIPTEEEAAAAPRAVADKPWYERATGALQKGNYKAALGHFDTAVQQGVRRALNLPVTRPPTADEVKDTAQEILAELTSPPKGAETERPVTEEQPTILGKLGAVAENAPVDFYNFLKSPAGVALPAAGFIGKTGQALIAAGFSSQMLTDAMQAAREGRYQDAMESILFAAGAGHGAREAMKPEIRRPTTTGLERIEPEQVEQRAKGEEPRVDPEAVAAPKPTAETGKMPVPLKSFEEIPEEFVQEKVAAVQREEKPLTKEEIAKREYEADLLREGEETIKGLGGMDLLEAIQREGGFPAKGTSGYNMWKGELQSLYDMGRGGKQFGGTNVFTGNLFSKSARGVDDLLLRLRARGFDVETPSDLIDRTITRLRTGRRDWVLPEMGVTLYGEQPVLAMPKAEGIGQGAKSRGQRAEIPPELFGTEETPFNLREEEAREEITPEGQARAKAETRYMEEKAQTELFRTGAQAATLPRQISPQPALPVNAGVPVAEADIRAYLSESLDIPMRTGIKVPGGMQGAAGVYRVKPETIRTRLRNNIPTIAHETGHYVHHLLLNDPRTGRPSAFANTFDTELMPLGRVTSKPSYPVDLVRKEGVAEFVREWLSDRAQAIAMAPKFTDFFEAELQSKFPQTWEIFSNARDMIRRFIEQPGIEKARSRIVFDPKPPRGTLRHWLSKQWTEWFDSVAPIKWAVDELVQFGYDKRAARDLVLRVKNYAGSSRSKADYDTHFGQSDINGKLVGPGYREIVRGLAPKEMQDLSLYRVLKRAQEKLRQGIKTGFEADLTDPEVLKWIGDATPRFEPTRQKLLQYSRNSIQLLKDSGYFTPEQIAKIEAANRDYAPFYRIYEGLTGQTTGPSKGGGFVNTSSGVLRMRGSDRQIIDPAISDVKNTFVFRDLAERNAIGVEFTDAVEATQGGGRISESILKEVRPTRISHEELVAHLEKLGLDESDIKSMGEDIGMTLWRATNNISAKKGQYSVWKNGKERMFQLDDPDLLQALSLSRALENKGSAWASIVKPFALSTKWLRMGATLTPEFIARNPFRDQISAGLYSEYGYVPFFDGFKDVFGVMGKNADYQAWLRGGGKYSSLYDVEGLTLQARLTDLIKEPTALQTALDLINPLNIIRNLAKASSILEETTRVGEDRRALASGASPTEAAWASKYVTLPFASGGRRSKAVNQLIAFFNANMLDVRKFADHHRFFSRSGESRARAQRTFLRGLRYITVPSLIAWYLGKDDPETQNLPEWRKRYFWNVNIPRAVERGGRLIDPDFNIEKDWILSLPKPFLAGAIYGTSVEKGLDYISGRDPNAIRKLFGAILQSGPATESIVVAANLFKPLVENISNYSFFTGRKLVSEGLQRLSPGMQFHAGSSETAKFVGKIINVSPIKIDNLIRSYAGGLGKYGTDVVDWAMLKFQAQDTPIRPKRQLSEYPIIRGFTKQPHEPSEYVQRFYKAIDRAGARLNDFGAYGQQLNAPAMRTFLTKNRDELAWYNADAGEATMMTRLREVRDNLSDINKAMVAVQQSRIINSQEKARRLKLLGDTRDRLAEAAFKNYVHPTDRAKVF